MNLKYDKEKYGAVFVIKNGNNYAFEKFKHPKWEDITDENIILCHPFNKDGTLNTDKTINIKKRELKAHLIQHIIK